MTPELIARALESGAQAYVTGQLRQPARAPALAANLFVFAIGHRRSEQWALDILATLLRQQWPNLVLREMRNNL
jgi:putative NIF3 family GTP cyclohydrolase 1 type 2